MEQILASTVSAFIWVMNASIKASVVVFIILGVKFLIKNKLNIRWHYLLWMLVILRLMLPVVPQTSFSVFNWISLESQEHKMEAPQVFTHKKINQPDITNNYSQQKDSAIEKQEISTVKIPWNVLAIPWLIGAILSALYLVVVNLKFSKKVKGSFTRPDKVIKDIFYKCKEDMKITRNVGIVLSDEIKSPSLYGLFNAKLLMPSSTQKLLTTQQLEYVCLHELAHYKRKDNFINVLFSILLLIHWFNPVLWYAYKIMREDQELACDALVLTYLEQDAQKNYGLTIVKLMEEFSHINTLPSLAGLAGNTSQTKRRITMIKSFKKATFLYTFLGALIVVGIGAVVLTNGNVSSEVLKKPATTAQKTPEAIKKPVTTETKTPKKVNSGPLIIQKDNPINNEIITHVEDPILSRTVNFVNGWHGQVDNGIVVIGAGALKDNPQQGIIMVRKLKNDRSFESADIYKVPGGHGAITIVSFEGSNLSIKCTDGKTGVFNYESRKLTINN